jgi:hypothetical protein
MQNKDGENRLLKKVEDDHELVGSLDQIREAMKRIWVGDRIVHDFTDHGEKHCERVANYASHLVDVKIGEPLSSEEAYLLLAGVYLHDIGMQCDLTKFPEIKDYAIRLGAEFDDAKFTAKTASSYSKEEQNAIRKNHNYLTAAWIEYAKQEGKSLLSNSIQTVPVNLLEDLIDVCMYHAKLPIDQCPKEFKFNPQNQKQLVALVLRFADELDISSDRVYIDTVKNFSFDEGDSIYWYLHNMTSINFIDTRILMTIMLNPKDVDEFGSIVEKFVINEFKDKNELVLYLLRNYGINLAYDINCGIRENRFSNRLPQDIVDMLKKKISSEKQDSSLQKIVESKSKSPFDKYKLDTKSFEKIMLEKIYPDYISERVYLVHSIESASSETPQDKGRFFVKVWLEAYGNDVDDCVRVIYRLYDDFPTRVYASEEREEGFPILLNVWGEFTIVAIVERRSNPPLFLTRYLDLPGRLAG